MINQETPQKKSQNPSSGSRPRTEEDLDFEILDALENIDDTGNDSDASLTGTDDEFGLDLDDDLMFDADRLGDTEQFSMEIDTAMGLSADNDRDADNSQLAGELDNFGLDTDIGSTVQVDENDDGSFSLDLDDDDDLDLSFDNDIDLDLGEETETAAFDVSSALEQEGFGISDDGSSDLDLGVFDAQGIDADDQAADDTFSFSMDDEAAADTVAVDMGGDNLAISSEFDMGMPVSSDTAGIDESFDDEEDDIDIDNMPDLDETIAEFATPLDSDNGLSDTGFAEMNSEQETEEFSGKGVISIDGDQVFDLGDEGGIGSFTDADTASWESDNNVQAGDDDYAEDDFLNDDEDDIDLAELAKGAERIVGTVVDDEPEQEPAGDEDFMASLNSISIDLHDDDDAEDEPETFDSDGAGDDFALPEDAAAVDENLNEEDVDVADFSDELPEVQVDDELENDFDVESPVAAEFVAGSHGEEPPEAEDAEPDVREALGLVPRLAEDDIRKFDQMVLEAKTLQDYIEQLEEHRPEIKTAIYYKLLKEYSDRKTGIFREPDFISIRIDVEQDLEDMLRKRADVHRTVSGLNDELEEVQVRHLVGEYSDDELAKQETSRKIEIDAWQQKTDRLEQFVVQYQELLETEKALNPGEEEPEDELMNAEMPPLEETRDTLDVEGGIVSHEVEPLVPEEDASFAEAPLISEEEASPAEAPPEEEPSLEEEAPFEDLSTIIEEDGGADVTAKESEDDAGEEPETFAELVSDSAEEESADISLGDLSDEIADMGDLTGMLEVDDGSDWDDGDVDDFELTAESFEDDDFSLDADFADDDELTGLDTDDFNLNGLTDIDDTPDADDETLAALAFGGLEEASEEVSEEASEPEEAMVSCKKCGRSTPSSEKFCVNCGAKAQ